ncbi:MAG: hypothetical protein JNL26_14675, partial [Gemmatimonadetes bacterium]|nr:hypothetical protein [Gemmatimonadota bacterium]
MSSRTFAFVDPRQAIRWVYVGRVGVCAGIYLAAVYAWSDADRIDTLVASLLITVALAFTAASATWSEIWGRPLTTRFLAGQSVFDLLVVTAIVHVTADGASQFAALYILVIAMASLLLPAALSLMVATLGCALYFWEILFVGPFVYTGVLWLQLAIFAVVALTSAFIGVRLRN